MKAHCSKEKTCFLQHIYDRAPKLNLYNWEYFFAEYYKRKLNLSI